MTREDETVSGRCELARQALAIAGKDVEQSTVDFECHAALHGIRRGVNYLIGAVEQIYAAPSPASGDATPDTTTLPRMEYNLLVQHRDVLQLQVATLRERLAKVEEALEPFKAWAEKQFMILPEGQYAIPFSGEQITAFLNVIHWTPNQSVRAALSAGGQP